MKTRICKLVSFVLCLTLLLGLCLPARAALTQDGKEILCAWIIFFDKMFWDTEEMVDGKIDVQMDKSIVDIPDGVIIISLEINAIVMRSGDWYRTYFIDNTALFNVFAANTVCQAVVDQGLMDHGVRVFMIAGEDNAGYLDEEALQYYIDMVADLTAASD